MLGVHLGEEHSQRFPHRCDGLHQQAAASPEAQPHPTPLQKTSSPAQQVRFDLHHLQEGEGQELLGNVSGDLLGYSPHIKPTSPASLVSGKGGWARWFYQGYLLNPSLTPPRNQTPLRRGGHLAVHLLLNLLVHLHPFPLFIFCLFVSLFFAFEQTISVEVWSPSYHFIFTCEQYATTMVLHLSNFTIYRHMLILSEMEMCNV